jgi:hypothetical protein
VHGPRQRRLPIGTTFSFTLSRAASVRLGFTESASGSLQGNRCVAPPRHHGNARRRLARCARDVIAAMLSFSGHAGVNTVHFEGRISPTKRLRPGQYTLVISASAARAQSSRPRRLQFTIVKS